MIFQQYLVHNFEEFKYFVVTFGKRHGERNAKLQVQIMSIYWRLFTTKLDK